MARSRIFLVSMGAVLAGLAGLARAEPPRRIVSLNLCTDQLLMALLPPERIASITWLSLSEGDPRLLPVARRIAVNHGNAEEVLAARPDLVIAGRFTTSATRALLRRVGVPLLEVDAANDWEAIRRVTREVGRAVGAAPRAEALIRQMDAELAGLGARRPAQPVRVIGWSGAADDVPGKDTLFNTIIETAGAVNMAAGPQRISFGLEEVVMAQPQVLLRGAAYSSKPALRSEVAHHPVLRAMPRLRIIEYPEAVYGCGVPHASRLALELAAALATAGSPQP